MSERAAPAGGAAELRARPTLLAPSADLARQVGQRFRGVQARNERAAERARDEAVS
jgi:hypothetical protein